MSGLVVLRPHRQAPVSDLDGQVEPMTWWGKLLTFALLLAAVGLPVWLILSDAIRESRDQAQLHRDLQQVKASHREVERMLADLARQRAEVARARAEVRR